MKIKAKMVNLFDYIRNRKILFLILFIQLLLIIIYIYNSTENIVYQDGLAPVNINLIEKFYAGKLYFNDLWKEYNGINIFGGLFITLVNVVFFRLNTRFEMLLAVFFMFITSLVMFDYFRKLVKKIVSNKIVQISFGLIIFIYFSLNQWENFVFNGGSMHIMTILPFVLMMIFYDKFIQSKFRIKNVFNYLLIVIFSILLGGQYTFGLVVSLLTGIFLKKIFDKKNNFDYKKSIFSIVIFIIIYLLFYLSALNNNVATGSSGVLNLFNDPISSLKFIFLTFSGTLIGVDLFNRLNMGINLGSLIGLIVVLTYLYALILYFKSKMSKKTIVPLVMVIYSIVTVGIIFVSRFSYGIGYGLTSRYTTSTMLGLIGCFIIFLYSLFSKRYFKKIKIISLNNFPIIVIFLFILICQFLTIVNEWIISPHRKVFYEKLEVMALNLDNYSKEDLSLFQAKNIDYIFNAFAVFKKYELNVFSENVYLSKQNGMIKLSGWYNDGWIGKSAEAKIISGQDGFLSIDVYIPVETFSKVYENALVLQIFINETKIKEINFWSNSFDKGPVNTIVDIPKNESLNLEIKLNKSFIPINYNLGEDSRDLGIIVSKIDIK